MIRIVLFGGEFSTSMAYKPAGKRVLGSLIAIVLDPDLTRSLECSLDGSGIVAIAAVLGFMESVVKYATLHGKGS